MVFNSVIFIYYFLPVVVGAYFLIRKWPKLQDLWLLAASFLFYGWCNERFLLFLVAFGFINYWFCRILHLCGGSQRSMVKNWVLFPAIVFNVLSLFVVKYLNFTIGIANSLLNTGISQLTSIFVPLGISFMVFSMIAYLVDVYRGSTKPLTNLVDFYLFLSFFPKVSQGPITRCEQMKSGLQRKTAVGLADVSDGLRRFCFGLSKKVLIADTLGTTVDMIFSAALKDISPAVAWVGILCYTFQILFDFSGYTDMAIGIGRMLGYHLPENFNAPYLSKSVSEFWRRWHITLGSWFREYVYIPLGGNRCGKIRTYLNLGIVWLLTGIWHGASYTYILWGLGTGCVIAFEKAVGKTKWYQRIPSAIKWLGTFLVIMFGWVLFRSNGIENAMQYFSAMFAIGERGMSNFGMRYYADNGTLLALLAAIILTIPVPARLKKLWQCSNCGVISQNVIALILLALALLFMVNSTYNAFIYFQF